MSPAIFGLIILTALLAIMYYSLAFGLESKECERDIKIVTITNGSIMAALAIFLGILAYKFYYISDDDRTLLKKLLLVPVIILSIAFFGTYIYNLYLLYRPKGLACKGKLWLANVIITSIIAANIIVAPIVFNLP